MPTIFLAIILPLYLGMLQPSLSLLQQLMLLWLLFAKQSAEAQVGPFPPMATPARPLSSNLRVSEFIHGVNVDYSRFMLAKPWVVRLLPSVEANRRFEMMINIALT